MIEIKTECLYQYLLVKRAKYKSKNKMPYRNSKSNQQMNLKMVVINTKKNFWFLASKPI